MNIYERDWVNYPYKKHKRRKEILKTFITLILFLIVIALLCLSVAKAMELPYVYYSWNTKGCLRVELAENIEGSCNQLPNKYILIWSE